MKLRKVMASVLAAAIAATAATVCASAAATKAIDFEDGKLVQGIEMFTDSGAAKATLSVVDYNGSKMLKVDVENSDLIPKVAIYPAEMVGSDNLADIACLSMDVIFATKDGTSVPDWVGGVIGSQGGEAQTPGWEQTAQWDLSEYNNNATAIATLTKEISADKPFVNGVLDTHFLLMRWANATTPAYDIYIDNIQFLKKDGRAITLDLKEPTVEEAPAETVETPAETAEVAVETEEVAVETEEVAVETEEIAVETEEIAVETEEVAVETEEVAVETEEVAVETEEIAVDTEEAVVTEDVAVDTGAESAEVDAPAADTNTGKDSPETGVEGVAVAAGVVALAGVAIVASRKRK